MISKQGKVILLEIKQTKMGNRGSKSDTSTVFVQEQRVYGSLLFYLNNIRCTLVAEKPVFGLNFSLFNFYYLCGEALLHSIVIKHDVHKDDNKLTTLVKPTQLMKRLHPGQANWTGSKRPLFFSGFLDGGCKILSLVV